MMGERLYTIGHSTHPNEKLIALLKQHGVTALADVRSRPYSRMNPQFNREEFKETLKRNGIAYVFLGKELGARSEDPTCYVQGKVSYARLAQTAAFREGLERIEEGMKGYRIALMCAEKDPLACHRTILVARHLRARGVEVDHILEDGTLESHDAAMARLLKQLKLPEDDMFRSKQELLEEAYRMQGERIAYEERQAGGERDTPKEKSL
jgi:uncharacterized protein (DUF488 family)